MKHALWLLAGALIAGCAHLVAGPAPNDSATADIDHFFAAYWEENLERNPLTATFIGDRRYNDRLPILGSPEQRRENLAFDRRWLDKARALDRSRLNPRQQLSLDVFIYERELAIEGQQWPEHLIPLNQFYNFAGFLAQLGSGTSAQPFATVTDYENWLARAAQIPVLFEQMQVNMRHGIERGIVQPRVLMERVIEQLQALIADDASQTLFWRPVQNFPEHFSDADRERLTAAWRRLLDGSVLPAYRELLAFVRDDYLPHARATHGLGALPDGEAWYAQRVRAYTTTELTPAQIHQIGLDEVARIHGAMRQLMQQVGFDGQLQDFFTFLNTDERFEFDSEQQLLDAYNALRERAEAGAERLFDIRPKAGFEIRPVEAFRAKSAAGGSYSAPSADGSRPGVFYVNTYDLPSRKTWDMENLFLHEAIPGHHFQIAIQQELENMPAFQRFGGYTAFIEGWALYAESLGKDMGLYQDPYSHFGALQAELWRAIRLVVDTGLHSKGWTREQVIDYMMSNSATSMTDAVSETERYMAIPGQALAYKIGQLKILELRRRAEAALGDRFDIKAFHRAVLQGGALPLDILEARIDRWIAARRA